MLAHFAVLVAMEAASAVASRYVLPAFTRRLEQASWPGRVALCGAAAAVGLSALAARPSLARGVAQSLALSQAGRAVTSLGPRCSGGAPARSAAPERVSAPAGDA